MVDIDEYLSTTTLAEKSKKTYKQAHKKLTDGLENSIIESSQRAIIQTIPTLTPSLNSQQALINIAIILFRANGKKLEMLDAAREATKQKIIEERNKGNAVKLETLPSRKQIDDYLNKLYNDGEWRSYVINYLLANIYVRNKDVNALIVDRVGKDKNENYVVNRKNDVLFVRRDYKTKGTYGEKQNQIKSAKLKKAVEELQKESEQKETPLLAKINGQRIGDDSLTNYIKERTKNNITESDMMKITINQIDETGDLRKLKMISDNRGTSIRTLIDNYKLKGFATEDVDDGKVKVTNDKGMDLMVTVPVPPKAQDTPPPPPPKPLTKWEEGLKSLGDTISAENSKGEVEEFRWIIDPRGEPEWDYPITDRKNYDASIGNNEWRIPARRPPKVIWYSEGNPNKPLSSGYINMWDEINGVWLVRNETGEGYDKIRWKTDLKELKKKDKKTGEVEEYIYDKETELIYGKNNRDKVVGEFVSRGKVNYIVWEDESKYNSKKNKDAAKALRDELNEIRRSWQYVRYDPNNIFDTPFSLNVSMNANMERRRRTTKSPPRNEVDRGRYRHDQKKLGERVEPKYVEGETKLERRKWEIFWEEEDAKSVAELRSETKGQSVRRLAEIEEQLRRNIRWNPKDEKKKQPKTARQLMLERQRERGR